MLGEEGMIVGSCIQELDKGPGEVNDMSLIRRLLFVVCVRESISIHGDGSVS